MKKQIKVIRIGVPEKLLGAHQVFPLLSADINLTLKGAFGLKNIKFKEIIVVYEEKITKFKGYGI